MRGHGEEVVGKRGFVGRLAVNMGLKENALKVENGTRDELLIFHTPLPLPVGGKQLWRAMAIAPGDKLPLLGGEQGSIVTVQVRRAGGFFTPYWQRTLSRQGDYKLIIRPERLTERFWTQAERLQHEWGLAPQPVAPGVLQRLAEAPPSPPPPKARQRFVSPLGSFRRGRSASPPPGQAGDTTSPLAPPRRQNSGNINASPPPAPYRRNSQSQVPPNGVGRSDSGGSLRGSPERSADDSESNTSRGSRGSRGTPESLESPPRAPVRQNSGRASEAGGGWPGSPEAAKSSTIQVLLPVGQPASPVDAPVRSKSPLARLFGRAGSMGSGTPRGTPRGWERSPPPSASQSFDQQILERQGSRGRSPAVEQTGSRGRSPPAPLERQDSNRSNTSNKSPRPKRSLSPFKCLVPNPFRRQDSGGQLPGIDSPSPEPTNQAPGDDQDIVDTHLSAHLTDMQIEDEAPVRSSIALQSAQNVRARGGPPDAPVRSPSGQTLLPGLGNSGGSAPEAPPFIPTRQHTFSPESPGSVGLSALLAGGAPSAAQSGDGGWFENEEAPDVPARKNFQMADPILSPQGVQYFSASHPTEEDEEIDLDSPSVPKRTAQLKPDAKRGRSSASSLLGGAPVSASLQHVKLRSDDHVPASSTLQLTKGNAAHGYAPLSASVQEVKSQFSRPNESTPQFTLQGRSPLLPAPGMHAPHGAPVLPQQAPNVPSPTSATSTPKAQGILSPRGVLRHTSSFGGGEMGDESDGAGTRRSRPTTPMNNGTPKGIKWAENLHESYENTPRNSIDGSMDSDELSRHRTGIPPRSGKRLNNEPLDTVDNLKRGQSLKPSPLDVLDDLLCVPSDVLSSNGLAKARSPAAANLPRLQRSQSERSQADPHRSVLSSYAAANSPVGTLQRVKSENAVSHKEDTCPACGLSVWAGQARFASTDGQNYHPECAKNYGGGLNGQYRS